MLFNAAVSANADAVELPDSIQNGVDDDSVVSYNTADLRCSGCFRGAEEVINAAFKLFYAQTAVGYFANELKLHCFVREAQKRTGMSLSQSGFSNGCTHGFRKLEQTQAVGQSGCAQRKVMCELLLSKIVLVEDGTIGLRFVKVVKILALKILNQRHKGAVAIECA